MKNIETKKKQEKKIIEEMILLYCKKKHKKYLCDDCKKVLDYSLKRITNCPFMEEKTFCSNCKKPCYNPKMKEKIKIIMKFSGPLMLFYHPILVIKHIIFSIIYKKIK